MREDQNGLTMDSGGLTGQGILFVRNCPDKRGWFFLHLISSLVSWMGSFRGQVKEDEG